MRVFIAAVLLSFSLYVQANQITLSPNFTLVVCDDIVVTHHAAANTTTLTCKTSNPSFLVTITACKPTLVTLSPNAYSLVCS